MAAAAAAAAAAATHSLLIRVHYLATVEDDAPVCHLRTVTNPATRFFDLAYSVDDAADFRDVTFEVVHSEAGQSARLPVSGFAFVLAELGALGGQPICVDMQVSSFRDEDFRDEDSQEQEQEQSQFSVYLAVRRQHPVEEGESADLYELGDSGLPTASAAAAKRKRKKSKKSVAGALSESKSGEKGESTSTLDALIVEQQDEPPKELMPKGCCAVS